MAQPSKWFLRGFTDGANGWVSHRPKPPSLRVRQLPRKKVEVTGNVKRYRKHLQRLGGTFDASNNAWIFPASAIERLQSDRELNAVGDLWSGCTQDELDDARREYSVGYESAQVHIARGPTAQRANRRR